jgi:hypothetical protein
MIRIPAVVLCIELLASTALAQSTDLFIGTGVSFGGANILTNAHVVEGCPEVKVQIATDPPEMGTVTARDPKNDLAIVQIKSAARPVVAFREGAPVRVGETVHALGYPLAGLLASSVSLSVGIVNALAGLGDDSRFLQISAPVQPGNSGGPLLDASGHLVGIVTKKLDALWVARYSGDIPQNVNFALKAEVAKAFLQSRGFAYKTSPSDQQLTPADVADLGKTFTAHIECRRKSPPRSAAAPQKRTPTSRSPSVGPAGANNWRTYSYQDEHFSAEFPGIPKAKTMTVDNRQWVRGVQYIANDASGEYLGQGMLYQPQIPRQYSSDVRLRTAIDGAKNAGRCNIRSERNYSFAGATAREVIFENCAGGQAAKSRFMLVHDWLYLILTIGKPGIEASADSDRFLASFRLIKP